MRTRVTAARLSMLLILAGGAVSAGRQLPSEPPRQFGTSVTGAFEGWFDNADGTHTFLVGYLNRNLTQAVDVAIGPNNRIEPGGPDMGQPTHFMPGRQTGVFMLTVPKDFKPEDRLTWTIVVNGQSTVIPLRLHTDYNVSPFVDAAVGNKPPEVRFEESGPALQGPVATLGRALTRTASIATPLSLTVWLTDDAKYSSGSNAPMRKPPPPVELLWSKYRGPGTVTFEKATPEVETLAGGGVNQPFRGKSTTTARFGEPGEYMLHLTANDYSGPGGGGEVCCWTTVIVKVQVK